MKNNKIKFRLEGAVLTALVLAMVILVNVIFGILGERYDLKLDLTGGDVYTLSDETKEVVSSIDSEITVYYATNAENRNSRYREILEEFDKKLLAKNLLDSYLQQLFIDGFFHGDPHPGNIMILENNVIILIFIK